MSSGSSMPSLRRSGPIWRGLNWKQRRLIKKLSTRFPAPNYASCGEAQRDGSAAGATAAKASGLVRSLVTISPPHHGQPLPDLTEVDLKWRRV